MPVDPRGEGPVPLKPGDRNVIQVVVGGGGEGGGGWGLGAEDERHR